MNNQPPSSTTYDPIRAQSRFLFLCGATAFIILLLIVLFLSARHATSSQFEIIFAPASATATLDGKVISSGTVTTSLGDHELIVEKFGFASETVHFSTTSGKNPAVYAILTSNSDYTSDWYTKHPSDATLTEGIIGWKATDTQDAIAGSLPAYKKLPYTGPHFKLYLGLCGSTETCVIVDCLTAYQNEALAYFRTHLDSNLGAYRFSFLYPTINPFRGEG